MDGFMEEFESFVDSRSGAAEQLLLNKAEHLVLVQAHDELFKAAKDIGIQNKFKKFDMHLQNYMSKIGRYAYRCSWQKRLYHGADNNEIDLDAFVRHNGHNAMLDFFYTEVFKKMVMALDELRIAFNNFKIEKLLNRMILALESYVKALSVESYKLGWEESAILMRTTVVA